MISIQKDLSRDISYFILETTASNTPYVDEEEMQNCSMHGGESLKVNSAI